MAIWKSFTTSKAKSQICQRCRERMLKQHTKAKHPKTIILVKGRPGEEDDHEGRGRTETPACPTDASRTREQTRDPRRPPERTPRENPTRESPKPRRCSHAKKIAPAKRKVQNKTNQKLIPVKRGAKVVANRLSGSRSSSSGHSVPSGPSEEDGVSKGKESGEDEQAENSCVPVDISMLTVSQLHQQLDCEEGEQDFPYYLRRGTNRPLNHPRKEVKDKTRPKSSETAKTENKVGAGISRTKQLNVKHRTKERHKANGTKMPAQGRKRSQSESTCSRPGQNTSRFRPPIANRKGTVIATVTEKRAKQRNTTDGQDLSDAPSCSYKTYHVRPEDEQISGNFKPNGKRARVSSSTENSDDEESIAIAWSKVRCRELDVRKGLDAPFVVHHFTRKRKAERVQRASSSLSDSSNRQHYNLKPNRKNFESLYILGCMLGKGGCGSVYAAIRRSDGQQVAIKHVVKNLDEQYVKLPGVQCSLPLEVALMQIVSRPPACPNVLRLLEWFEEPTRFVLVLERPYPCMDLFDFVEEMGGRLEEGLARTIMLQVVLAVRHCRDRGVLHRDVKAENLLIHTDNLKVKLIDFGCGDLLRESTYLNYAGTEEFCPPEWVEGGCYQGRPATIWSLGVLLFSLVCGWLPFSEDTEIVSANPLFRKGIREDCKDLIKWCLQRDPTKRPVLEQILLHDWMADE